MLQTATLAFLAGILLLQTRNVLPSSTWLFVLPVVLLVCVFSRHRLVLLICFLVAGFLWAQYRANHLLEQRLPHRLENKTLQVTGYIASLPIRTADRIRFDLEISKTDLPDLTVFPHKVRLSWYTHEPVILRPGDKWHFSLRLRSPHGFMSPGAFDYNAWLLQQGIVTTGYVYYKGIHKAVGHSMWRYPVQTLRFYLQQQMNKSLRGLSSSGIIKALIIGDRSGIDKSDWEVLQRTGTVHLMAISGLHVGMVAGFIFFLVGQIWRRIPGASLHLAAPKVAAIAAWMSAFLYAGLAGFAVPTQRALLMLAVILMSIYFQRAHKSSQVFSVALLLVLIWDPLSVLSAGFWLSFSAVAFIYYVLKVLPQHLRSTSRWWRLQLAISLGLFPLLILYFQKASLLSPLANLIAIPWVSLLVLPIALISTLFLAIKLSLFGSIGLHLAASLMGWLQLLLQWFSSWHFSQIHLPAPGLLTLGLGLAGILILLLPRAMPARYLGIVLVLPLFLPNMHTLRTGSVRLSLLDVGQGLSAVVQTAHHTLVFDAGPRFSQSLNAGQAVVQPFLNQQGVSEIDKLVISHSDRDHIGGMSSLLKSLAVKQIMSSVPGILRHQRDKRCLAGQRWNWDGVSFQILYPSPIVYQQQTVDNNRSCVLKITTKYQQFLLTGDIEALAEHRLLAEYAGKLHSSVLVVAHHGSRTSSTPEFLDAVHPELALIPAGWHNRFHFPTHVVMARLGQRHVKTLTTASSGTIQIDAGQHLRIHTYRAQHPRYWQVW